MISSLIQVLTKPNSNTFGPRGFGSTSSPIQVNPTKSPQLVEINVEPTELTLYRRE